VIWSQSFCDPRLNFEQSLGSPLTSLCSYPCSMLFFVPFQTLRSFSRTTSKISDAPVVRSKRRTCYCRSWERRRRKRARKGRRGTKSLVRNVFNPFPNMIIHSSDHSSANSRDAKTPFACALLLTALSSVRRSPGHLQMIPRSSATACGRLLFFEEHSVRR
jgi:hypothetical protein